MTAAVLVTGGAGYIGSHTTRQLVQAGFRVVVADNLYSGFRWAVDPAAEFVECDVGDSVVMSDLIRAQRVTAVVHFAGHIVVPESVQDPLKYYRNNCLTSQQLLQSCREQGVNRFVFSSSAAVYGQPPLRQLIDEATPPQPISPYGRTKLVTEWLLQDLAASGAGEPFHYLALRYFNVAGAALDTTLGQATPAATHLIKVACEAACGKRPQLEVFGNDYPTGDGTCVRDYIHVEDLAHAHVLAVRHLLDGGDSDIMNCGYGHGFSVRQVAEAVRRVSGVEFSIVDAPRRAGDPAELVADSQRLRNRLGWSPRHDDLELICRTAWQWERALARRLAQTA